MNEDTTPSVLILGASSGFGEAAVHAFAQAGYDIYGVHLDRRAGLKHVEEIAASVEALGRQARFFNVNAADADKRAAVLDVEVEGQRKLAESVVAAGLEVQSCTSLQELVELLSSGEFSVGVIAYEALWPDPQQTLRWVRDHTPGTRILVAYGKDTARKRLGQRLWAIGMFDYFVPRAAPTHEWGPLLRQAHADAMIEGAEEVVGV